MVYAVTLFLSVLRSDYEVCLALFGITLSQRVTLSVRILGVSENIMA